MNKSWELWLFFQNQDQDFDFCPLSASRPCCSLKLLVKMLNDFWLNQLLFQIVSYRLTWCNNTSTLSSFMCTYFLETSPYASSRYCLATQFLFKIDLQCFWLQLATKELSKVCCKLQQSVLSCIHCLKKL